MRHRTHRFAALAAVSLTLGLSACAMPPVQGSGVVTAPPGEPAGTASLVVEQDAGWPTPLATMTLPGGEVFRGKVVYERTEPELGFGFATGYGWGTHRGGLGYGGVMLRDGRERTSRASALLISDGGLSMSCDMRTAYPGRLSSGGFADCRVSDGRIVAVQF